NPGATNFAKMISSNNVVPIIVSLVGSVEDDFDFMIKQFENCKVSAYELNLSCPHVAKVGLEVGDDIELVKKIVKKVKSDTNVPVIAKVGLGTTNYLDTVSAACESGADGITAINTIRAMAIDVETQKPILSNKVGGLSGTPIKPIAVRCVYEISSKFDVPIIGCGGISTWQDAVEFILAGASAVQFGSVLGEHWIEVFAEINTGIQNYMEQKGYSTIGEMVGKAKKS
ncbi:Dihydroorotate dehydrogenase B catalytic subunit protein, partial [Marine Group I thaumarchaeote SCGC AAA799-O18]